MDLHGRHLIGSQTSIEAEPGFFGRNPRGGQRLEPGYADATPDEIDRAVRLAEEAQTSIRNRGREERARLLDEIATRIEALGDPLLERAESETALPQARLTMERGRTCNQLRLFASVLREGSFVGARIDTAIPDRTPVPKPDVRRMLTAIGPVAVFGASNFPLAFSVAGGDTASALAAGCPVVVKGHPNHPGTSEMVGRAVAEAVQATGFPEGTLSLIHGESYDVSIALVRHPGIRAVGFTGSLAGGRALLDAANTREDPIPVFAEMGSVNPVAILDGALRERSSTIAEGLVGAVTLGVGQFCTSPGLVLVQDGDDARALVSQLTALFNDAPEGTFLHAGIRRGFEAGCRRLDEADGVQRTGRALAEAGPGGASATPTIYTTDASTFLATENLAEEVFGPSTLVVLCSSRDEMLRVCGTLPGQLTATVHATPDDLTNAGELLSVLEEKAGRVIFNGFPTGLEVCPSIHHGGPWPATTDAGTTSVGTAAVRRFQRPVCYQGFPHDLLPKELWDDNPCGILRMVNGSYTRDP